MKIYSGAGVIHDKGRGTHTAMSVTLKIAVHMIWIRPDVAEVAQCVVAVPVAFAGHNPSDLPTGRLP